MAHMGWIALPAMWQTMTATISPCGTYRYTLHRHVQKYGMRACVIMVNPSTADATINDPTIKKLIGFGKGFQWSEFTVVNKFAYRATDVNELVGAEDADGPLNEGYILAAMLNADIIVVAWGTLNKLPMRLRGKWRVIAKLAAALDKPLYCLGVCNDGHPKHPVMLGYANQLVKWEPPL